jgi:hypothetical protein
MTHIVTVNHELLSVAERLTVEYDEFAAGSVLRCFARAVRSTRVAGRPLSSLPQDAELLTRTRLATRMV